MAPTRLSAYSSEIRRWMTWQLSDRETLEKMLKEVDEHVRDPARRRHVVGIPLVEFDGELRPGHVAFLAVPDQSGGPIVALHGRQLR